MKTVILTNNGSEYGKWLIKSLLEHQVEIERVIVINQPLSYNLKLFGYVRKRVGLFQALYFSVREVLSSILKKAGSAEERYEDLLPQVQYTDGTNTPATEAAMKAIAPDVLVLAQTGIVRKNILTIPRLGTLNAHPGILPDYRGIDCYKWAVFNGDFDKIGATLHWVNAGVDTGNIIERRRFSLAQPPAFHQMEQLLYLLCVDLIRDNLQLMQQGEIPVGTPQQKEQGRQFYKMPVQKEWKTERIFKALSHNPVL